MAERGGQPGNTNGSHDKPVLKTILRAIAQDDAKRLRNGVEKVLDLFEAGDPWAVQWITERVEGKAKQQVDVTSGDQPIQLLTLEQVRARLE